MDRLPNELLHHILQVCVTSGHKNLFLDLRLVSRTWNVVLKPLICRTVNLEFSRLTKGTVTHRRPQIDALQTIGYHCKSMFIDVMLLRDDVEVEFLRTLFRDDPLMRDFCQLLQTRYCMNEKSFTEQEYRDKVTEMLFYCRNVDRLRLNLPYQLVGNHCNAATILLANTFAALRDRPEEDSAKLKVLVLENVTDIAICNLWTNPCDIENIMIVLDRLEHLVLTIRRREPLYNGFQIFSTCLWEMVRTADNLKSFCLGGLDYDEWPPQLIRQTRPTDLDPREWQSMCIPNPNFQLDSLACLELKGVELDADFFVSASRNFGTTLRELFLTSVFLKVDERALLSNAQHGHRRALWVGPANQRPTAGDRWVAMIIREGMPNLNVCRARYLGYHFYGSGDQPLFDLMDPCGLARSLAQRFVEVVSGMAQPDASDGQPVQYFPADQNRDHLLNSLRPHSKSIAQADYDTYSYQDSVTNTTSKWAKCIDEIFANCNQSTVEELHYIAETACRGMKRLQERRTLPAQPLLEDV